MPVAHHRHRGLLLLMLPLLVALLSSPLAAGSVGSPSVTTSRPSLATVGVLFPPGIDTHSCTASVIRSSTHDLILTAAHCVTGDGTGYYFAPGYGGGSAPYGKWPVTRAYVPKNWIEEQGADSDYAVLRVAPLNGRQIEQVVGGNLLGLTPKTGNPVTVVAYNLGAGDDPVVCQTQVSSSSSYPSFGCAGYSGGTSGGPWLYQVGPLTYVTGLIGGPNQGGCTDDTSYSAPFTGTIFALVVRAEAREPSDSLPSPWPNGC